MRLSPASARVRARPVVRGRQAAVALAPVAHRDEHPLLRPAPLDRARVAGLAVRVGVALAVARLRVRAAAAAHADVAGLDRPRLLAGRVVEVRLDRRRRATETVGDLPDREALDLAVMPRQGDRPATLENPTRFPRLTPRPSHRVTLPRSIGVFVEVGARMVPRLDLLPAQSETPDASPVMLVDKRKQGPGVMTPRVGGCRISPGAEAWQPTSVCRSASVHDQQAPRTVAAAGTGRSFGSVRWAVEVRLHRRRGATQAIGDLRRSTRPRPRGNVAPGDRPTTLEKHEPFPPLTRRPSRRATLPRSIGVFVDVGAPSGGAPVGPPTRALPGGLVGQRDARAGSRAGCTVIGFRHEHHAVLDYVLGRPS